MVKIENVEVTGWDAAIRGMPAKGYRKTKSGNFECFVSNHSKNISLGTYETEELAKQAVFEYRIARFKNAVLNLGLNPLFGVVAKQKYVAFPTGQICNLYGEPMIGCVDRGGYKEVVLNGKMERVHRIVAEAFIPNPNSLPCVNHKDGNKLNNAIDNLEWCTYSENTKHAYDNGLEHKRCGEEHHAHKLTEKNVKYIRQVYIKRDKAFGAVALAKKFDVDRTTIRDIVSNKSWRNLV